MAITVHTTEELVREILDEDQIPEDASLDGFMLAAAMVVAARTAGLAYTADEIVVLETWMAAHCACLTYPLLAEEWIGRSKERVDRKIGLGLDQTPYGQMVKTLDYLGAFRKRLVITWLGTVPAGVGEVL